MIDGLTGIANRRRFDEALEREWRRCHRGGSPLSLILVDVDFFKNYNDHYGHLAGDECLKKVAVAMADQSRRGSDLVARFVGFQLRGLLLLLQITWVGQRATATPGNSVFASALVAFATMKTVHNNEVRFRSWPRRTTRTSP